MTDLNESFKEFAKLQADVMKPVRETNGLVVDSFESYARLSYATFGDLIDYTIEQTQLAATAEDLTGLMSKQYEKAKGLSEKIAGRFNESNELAKDFFSSMQKVEVAPMFEAPSKAARKVTA
ncbi:MAG: hypothetical protein ACI82Z_000325 [Cellvibrionaceae bacterium]|jgi:hypothetical protein